MCLENNTEDAVTTQENCHSVMNQTDNTTYNIGNIQHNNL